MRTSREQSGRAPDEPWGAPADGAGADHVWAHDTGAQALEQPARVVAPLAPVPEHLASVPEPLSVRMGPAVAWSSAGAGVVRRVEAPDDAADVGGGDKAVPPAGWLPLPAFPSFSRDPPPGG
jgi:hypothetical protein